MRIEFEMTKDDLVFRDAIELPNDHGLSESEIDKLKQSRFNAWLAAIAPQSVEE
jgi:hypothetical protein